MIRVTHVKFGAVYIAGLAVAALLVMALGSLARSSETLTLRESFTPGYQYHVSTRTELAGALTVPAAKPGGSPKSLNVRGNSVIEYDERVLELKADGAVQKTARVYRQLDFSRKVGNGDQATTLRPAVRRLILLRHEQMEVPFSPDGPLTWNELDLVRTDVFTPALVGLLPIGSVSIGQQWRADVDAVKELTDLERIEEGSITCKMAPITTLEKRRHARVDLTGNVRGINEDGPNRQQLDGYYYFDLGSNHLSYIYLRASSHLLDKTGKELGKVEGQFVLTRHAKSSHDLTETALRGVPLEPNDDNTRLLYENGDLGVRFLHPRRWRIANAGANQIMLDESAGAGLVISVEPLDRVPTAAQFQAEVAEWLRKQQARIQKSDPVRRLSLDDGGDLDYFSMEVEMEGKPVVLEYYVVKQRLGGATFAARLNPSDAAATRKDIEQMARSLTVTRPRNDRQPPAK